MDLGAQPEWIESTNVYRFMRRLGFRDREEFLRFSRDESTEQFWDEMVREIGIEWFQPYERVLDDSRGAGVVPLVCQRQAEHRLELPGPARRGRVQTQSAVIWEGENGATRSVTYRGPVPSR